MRQGSTEKRVTMAEQLSRKQFDILSLLAMEKQALSLDRMEEETGYTSETVSRIMEELTELALVREGMITDAGMAALEPYRAKRAVFIAAGFGSRLAPITLNTPKPLVRVNGKRIIDGLIDACLEAGITEIYVVRGYLAEQFDQLRYKYPMLHFLENPAYNEANNISSAMCARYLLSNAYVFEADLLISNPKIIKPYHYTSDFLAIKKDRTEDWCFEVEDGVIVEEKVGGLDCWQMVGISYWKEEDGCRLAHDIQEVFAQPGGKECYWEQVPLVYCKEHYQVAVLACREEDIVEIDTFRELQAIDKAYDV